jgi:riboflavin kinase/FMN adenylyltransferase
VRQILPAYGVYAGYVVLARSPGETVPVTFMPPQRIPAVFSLGVRPTVAQPAPAVRIEAHLLEGRYGLDELYGLRAGYYLAHRLRGEQRFADLEELRQQMRRDITTAQGLL